LILTIDSIKFSLRNWRYGLFGSIALTLVLWSGTNVPGLALSTQFAPVKPHLGDTVVVNIASTSDVGKAPTIKVGDKSYPAFAIEGKRFRAMIPTTPIEKTGERNVSIVDNKVTTTLQINVGNRKFPFQRINLPPGKSGVDATEIELKRVAAFKATISSDKHWNGKFIAPNKGRISSPFGVRRYYNGKLAEDYYHRGLDYAGGYGSAIVAPAGGEVVLVGYEKNGFRIHGNVVGVDHGQGVVSIFMHMSKINVEEGQMLEPGDKIGAIGTTGASTGAHLHWGLYVNGIAVDPGQWRSTSIE
jgi:murein DD-endopeptidase MepM/ murein hydrolase activator NlpD